MNALLTIVVPFRNRDLSRVEALFLSVQKNTKTPFEFLVSDYGSEQPCAFDLAALSKRLSFQVVRSESQGLPWSRSKAINTGARQVKTPLVAIVDVDMVFHDAVLDQVASIVEPDDAYFLESIWPQSPKADPLRGVINRSYGVFHLLHTQWFDRLNGFCEAIQFWGGEDNDWVRRLVGAGVKIHWLEAKDFKLTHTWHSWENNPVTRPLTSVTDTLRLEMANLIVPYRNEAWGKPYLNQDRPILQAMNSAKVFGISLENKPLMDHVPVIVKALREGQLIRLDFGERIRSRKFTALAPYLLALQNWFSPFSLRLEYNVSSQMEEALTLISLLGGVSNLDLYFQDSSRSLFLLLRGIK